MAEASQAATAGSSSTYYCHVCNEDISPVLPAYTCPTCQGGFIEKRESEDSIADDPDDELPPMDDANPLHNVAQMLNFVPFQALGLNRPLVLGGSAQPGHSGAPPGAHPTHQPGSLGELLDSVFANFSNVRVNVHTDGAAPIHFRLHGNPGDYAWGNTELDRIVTQLLNQMDTSGPPPLQEELIRRLPTVQITQESIDANMQCMVCFEDYTLGEKVRELPCAHLYHSPCIVPWLELHGTCPVCRSAVAPVKSPASEPQPPGPADAHPGPMC